MTIEVKPTVLLWETQACDGAVPRLPEQQPQKQILPLLEPILGVASHSNECSLDHHNNEKF